MDYPKKYHRLIDAEMWAFIDKSNQWFPPQSAELPIEKQREIYDVMSGEFLVEYPDGVESEDGVIETPGHGVAFRYYRNAKTRPLARVVYCHGGGFVFGGLDSHDDVCAEICAATGFEVLSIDYRLSPEHGHPAAYEDTLAGYEYGAKLDPLPIVMVGDSAGATLVAAVCHKIRSHERKPVGQVLIYPSLGGDPGRGSYIEHRDAPLLNVSEISFFTGIRDKGGRFAQDATYAPLADEDFSGLPPTVIVSAECDPLSDDGRNYCARVVESGGRAKWINEPGLVHGFLRARHSSRKAKESFSRITGAVAMLGEGGWDY